MILGVVLVCLNSIHSFVYSNIIVTSRRADLQNEVVMLLSHISKSAVLATGNEIVSGTNSVVREQISLPNMNNDRVTFNIDSDGNGVADRWIGYRIRTGDHIVEFCSDCGSSNCGSCSTNWMNVAEDILLFNVVKPENAQNCMNNNTITVVAEACRDQSIACGTMNNPSINMTISVTLPKVSVN